MAERRRGLVLVAHGSRREASNDEVRRVAAQLAEQSAGRFEMIHAAFLELAEPLIPAGVQCCIDNGMEEVVVLPYFLSAGRHVVEDIPAEVAKVNNTTGAEVRIAPYLGAAPGLADILLEQSEK
ncbi:MAG: CbiX/SirB N-terminal domain-containing protein [Chromatiales bacterium]|nr:CbiX/SirB N-terminal domain-containing protein [Chromatiales bacterium]